MRVIISVLTIIINLYAREVYISFSFVSKNFVLYSSHFNCSYAMENECCKKKYLFSLDVSGNDVVKICYNNREKIINRLYSYDIAVSSHEKINDTTAKLVFTPKLFDIIIKDNRAYFYICKE